MNRPKIDFSKAPKKGDPGFHEYWFAVGLYERDQAIHEAVHASYENLYNVETASENLRCYIIANIHNEDFMNIILDMVNEFNFKL